MVTDEQLTKSTEIASVLIMQCTQKNGFSRRINERIRRLEAKSTKKKFDTLSLTVISVLIVLVSILIVIEMKLDIFPDDSDLIYIPAILLGVLVIVGAIFTAEYFVVKKEGERRLQLRVKSLPNLEKQIRLLQREQTLIYNYVKEAFGSVETVDSKYLLDGFILRFYVNIITKEITDLEPEKLYRYLFLISTKKRFSLEKVAETIEAQIELRKIIKNYLTNYVTLLTFIINNETLPIFFKDSATRSKENIDLFSNYPS
ncbi:MAG: hypothetical protein ACTSSH_09815, partial [Candidatus Heimdallarchaeota archaeon]